MSPARARPCISPVCKTLPPARISTTSRFPSPADSFSATLECETPDYNETVSKAKNVEERLERIEQQLRLFQRVSRFMVREMSLHEVLQGIVSLVVEFTQCD